MFKIIKEEAHNYLTNKVPKCKQNIEIKNNHIPTYHCRKKYSFFFPP